MTLVFVMLKAKSPGSSIPFFTGLRLGSLLVVQLCQFPHPCTILGSLDRALVWVQKPGPSCQPHTPLASRIHLGKSFKYINAVYQIYQICMIFLTR